MKTILSFLHVLFVSAYVALASASNNGTKSEAFANSTNEVDVARRQIPSVVCPTGCMNNYAHTTGNCLCSDGAAGGQTCGDGTIASLSEGDLFCYNNGICMSNAGACPNPLPGLFISEMIEGSKYNRAVELYNPTAADIDLSLYYLGQTVNGWCQASFEDRRAGACGDDFPVPQKLIKLSDTGVATLASGATYVLCHSQAIAGDGSRGVVLSDACTHDAVDQAHPINFNGDDAIVLISGTAGSWKVVDSVGAIGPDPGTAFDVCGVSRGTKDKTLVRKPAVVFGNGGDWTASSGTTADDCEWIVFDKDTGTEMASHECVLPLSLAPTVGLFISEMIEGGSYNKAVELYNPTMSDIDLSMYYLGHTVNGKCQLSFTNTSVGLCGEDFTVPQKLIKLSDTGIATLAPGATYVICHSKAIAGGTGNGVLLSDACTHDASDWTHPISFNGDDAIVLISGTADSWSVVDTVGKIGPDPGTAFDVCGERGATKDKTLVRKPAVVIGNGGNWNASSGTSADDCEWIVLDKDTGTEVAAHECVLPDWTGIVTTTITTTRTVTTTTPSTVTTTTFFEPKAPNLFISEMIEGGSYNKAIELYNPTAADIDLSLYYLGSTVNGNCQKSFTNETSSDCGADYPVPRSLVKLSDTGVSTLASGATYVLCHAKAVVDNNEKGLLLSDACTHSAGDYSVPVNFNGDDAIVLIQGTADDWTVVDIVGVIGPDPGRGFDVCGVRDGTADRTLVRKPEVVTGNWNRWRNSAGTDASDCEWIVHDKDMVEQVAAHTCVLPAASTAAPSVAPTTGTTATPVVVTIVLEAECTVDTDLAAVATATAVAITAAVGPGMLRDDIPPTGSCGSIVIQVTAVSADAASAITQAVADGLVTVELADGVSLQAQAMQSPSPPSPSPSPSPSGTAEEALAAAAAASAAAEAKAAADAAATAKSSSIGIEIGISVAVVLIVIVIAVKVVKQPNNAGTRTDNGPTSFDNPLYAEAGGAGVMKENPLADTDQDGEESGGGGYLEVGITSNG